MFGCGTWAKWWSVRFSWTRIASGAVAEASSVTTGSSRYSTLIFAAARRAVSGWSAATMATGSPWWRTLPWARTGVSRISSP